jgi:transposase
MISIMNRAISAHVFSQISTISATLTRVSTQQSDGETVEQVRAEKDLVIAGLQAALAESQKMLEAALFRINRLSRQLFSRSSERYDHPDQQRLDLGELTPAAPAGPVTVIPPQAKGIVPGREIRAGKAKRKPIPDTVERIHLPARELTLQERTLPDGRILEAIGVESSERLQVIPMQFIAEVEHRIIYGIPVDAENAPAKDRAPRLIAPAAPQIIPDGLPTTALLVQVAFQKFGLHLPLHRQAQEFARLGFAIAKSSMCGWLSAFAAFLAPVVKALEQQVLSSSLLHSDDIPITMLLPDKGTRQVRFWSYLGSGPGGDELPQVLFVFTESRAGRHPTETLGEYHGALMADALAQYDRIVAANGIIRLLCWAHARREFYDARHLDPRCHEMVLLIAKLSAAEKRAKDHAERHQLGHLAACRWRWRLRQRYSVKVLALIHERLKRWAPLTGIEPATPDSPLGKAVLYSLKRWTLLTSYADTGDWPMDNNPAENAQRPIAVGRRNHLFLGSETGGINAAVFYSLIQSCRLQKIDPVGYLKEISERMLQGETDHAALTPHAVADARRRRTMAAPAAGAA